MPIVSNVCSIRTNLHLRARTFRSVCPEFNIFYSFFIFSTQSPFRVVFFCFSSSFFFCYLCWAPGVASVNLLILLGKQIRVLMMLTIFLYYAWQTSSRSSGPPATIPLTHTHDTTAKYMMVVRVYPTPHSLSPRPTLAQHKCVSYEQIQRPSLNAARFSLASAHLHANAGLVSKFKQWFWLVIEFICWLCRISDSAVALLPWRDSWMSRLKRVNGAPSARLWLRPRCNACTRTTHTTQANPNGSG